MKLSTPEWPVARGGDRLAVCERENKIGQKPCTSRMQKRQVAGMCLSQTKINSSTEGV